MRIWFTVIGFHVLAFYLPVAAALLYFRPTMFHSIMAFFLGLLTAFLDWLVAEPQFTVVLLLAFGLFLGFLQPSRGWRHAILLALWVPCTSLFMCLMNGGSFLHEGLVSFVAFVPAYWGTRLGMLIHSTTRGDATRQRSPLRTQHEESCV